MKRIISFMAALFMIISCSNVGVFAIDENEQNKINNDVITNDEKNDLSVDQNEMNDSEELYTTLQKSAIDDKLISYQTHVQDYGWQSIKYDGETSGTSGQCKRLEAIKINLNIHNVMEQFNIRHMFRTMVGKVGRQMDKHQEQVVNPKD